MKRLYIACAITLLNLVVLVIAIEVPFRIAHDLLDDHRDRGIVTHFKEFIRDHFHPLPPPVFSNSWEKDLRSEINGYSFRQSFQPFEEFRMAPFQGKSLNVGSDGFRIVPGQYDHPDLIVYMIGDSATVGPGSPDWLTIPADLQKLLSENTHRKINVYNRGVGGWDSFQEVVYLIEQLKEGHVPNVVIFYGGFSDACHSVINGKTRSIWYQGPMTALYNGDSDLVNLTAGRRGWMRIRFISFIIKKMRSLGIMKGPFVPFIEQPDYSQYTRLTEWYPQQTEDTKEALARDTFEAYKENIHLVQNLARIYHFVPYFYWQPLMYPSATHKHLTPYENSQANGQMYAYVDMAARMMRYVKNDPQDVVNLCPVFDNVSESTFFDVIHLTALGDQKIAETIYNQIVKSTPFASAAGRVIKPVP